ncbi:PAS domain-containing protein [Sphingomonas sp. QA11]|uniref:sensor histidine kinase n=1 Tax=Sphingomonas sp. QA11 TaxID=2950605 RepID=UPI002349C792|nr:histidine kinase dimerization/phosphoacceptor domain -containing protein [Sphingomonas sp. QA11]WCM27051.1 PAS domain-containing protein [Sphingomonas sp. QA11]
MAKDSDNAGIEQLLETPDLADALESDRFKQFLDHVPVAIAVSELHPAERITYANLEFERLTGQSAALIEGKSWDALPSHVTADDGRALREAVVAGDDYLGTFTIADAETTITVDAWSTMIQGDDGSALFRLVALAEVRPREDSADLEQRLRNSDTLLRELQHRVKNNLQMITALIRLEARNLPDDATERRFDRLAGRIDALALLYRSLSDEGVGESIDLGIYLSEIASSVMRAHAVEGIHLDLQIDTWPVSVNVAMPAGLVVNELLTNALKHAFAGRDGGTITLHSIVDDTGCRVVVADDGIGLAEGVTWPKAGKLGALIAQSLRQNAKARIEIESAPGAGMRVTIFFARADAAPTEG